MVQCNEICIVFLKCYYKVHVLVVFLYFCSSSHKPYNHRVNTELSLDSKTDSVFWVSNEDIGIVFYWNIYDWYLQNCRQNLALEDRRVKTLSKSLLYDFNLTISLICHFIVIYWVRRMRQIGVSIQKAHKRYMIQQIVWWSQRNLLKK